jgi:hypothetical protein
MREFFELERILSMDTHAVNLLRYLLDDIFFLLRILMRTWCSFVMRVRMMMMSLWIINLWIMDL